MNLSWNMTIQPQKSLVLKKMDLICQVLISKNKIPDFYKGFQQLAKLQKRIHNFLNNNCDMWSKAKFG
jgi:hypothetical protein